jgi:hypothetical protein
MLAARLQAFKVNARAWKDTYHVVPTESFYKDLQDYQKDSLDACWQRSFHVVLVNAVPTNREILKRYRRTKDCRSYTYSNLHVFFSFTFHEIY